MAVANYESKYGRLPPPYLTDDNGRPMHSWRILILPFIGYDDLYKQYDFSEPWDGPNNRKLAPHMPKTFALHGVYQPGLTTTNYLAVVGLETAWPNGIAVSYGHVNSGDGTANTILLVENRGLGVHWMEPRDLLFEEMSFEVNNPHGVSSNYADAAVVMLDGSVQRLHKHLTPRTLRAMLTINGGEELRGGYGEWELLPDGRQREIAKP